jgi:hypothetical protein
MKPAVKRRQPVRLDAALSCAQGFVDCICECGHSDSEHVMLADDQTCKPHDMKRCGCTFYRPVTFTVAIEAAR